MRKYTKRQVPVPLTYKPWDDAELFKPITNPAPIIEGSMNFDYLTLESFIDECRQIKSTFSGSATNKQDFCGVSSLNEAIELAEKGWPDGKKHMERFATKITERVKASLPHQMQVWDTSGLDFDMGLVLAGQPESWYDFSPKDETKFIKLGINGFFSAGVNDNVITMRGGAICAIVDALESINYRVEIDIMLAAKDLSKYASRIRVKNFQDSLDLDRLAFLTTNKAFFRAMCISHGRMKANSPYGAWFSKSDHEWTKGYDIYFSDAVYGGGPWDSFEKAEVEILRLLKEQGVDLTTKVQGD